MTIPDLPESDLLDLRAQFDEVVPTDSAVIDVGVVQSLTKMALRSLERDAAHAEGVAAERERIAMWFEDMWVAERGPDWGLASQDQRRAWADKNRQVLRYAALIREAKP